MIQNIIFRKKDIIRCNQNDTNITIYTEEPGAFQFNYDTAEAAHKEFIELKRLLLN